ncbi:hypothetical protein AHiyo8_29790 [Arthrobacter sp. Hiyo8]|nr:hypothetical protein AHiyo8_29790 [Arthrobacter sp. Hiyo8]
MDTAATAAFLERHGIQAVVDLRSAYERAIVPWQLANGAVELVENPSIRVPLLLGSNRSTRPKTLASCTLGGFAPARIGWPNRCVPRPKASGRSSTARSARIAPASYPLWRSSRRALTARPSWRTTPQAPRPSPQCWKPCQQLGGWLSPRFRRRHSVPRSCCCNPRSRDGILPGPFRARVRRRGGLLARRRPQRFRAGRTAAQVGRHRQ